MGFLDDEKPHIYANQEEYSRYDQAGEQGAKGHGTLVWGVVEMGCYSIWRLKRGAVQDLVQSIGGDRGKVKARHPGIV
jgi:hypothetical protein